MEVIQPLKEYLVQSYKNSSYRPLISICSYPALIGNVTHNIQIGFKHVVSPQFLKVEIGIICLALLLAFLIHIWKTGKLKMVSEIQSKLMKYNLGYWRTLLAKIRDTSQMTARTLAHFLKSPYVIKRTAICIGICALTGLVTFSICNWERGIFVLFMFHFL